MNLFAIFIQSRCVKVPTIMTFFLFATSILFVSSMSCSKECTGPDCGDKPDEINSPKVDGKAIRAEFGSKIDPDNLANYANQPVPNYITLDNGTENPITDESATLGRVLFYDKNLSVDNTLSCGSCHLQKFAFNDTALVSRGVMGGVTQRHAMRLVNSRFGAEKKFFWDERAPTLEDQTTMPIKDHAELGFSGKDGRPDFPDLINKLESIQYYQELFAIAFGDPKITEQRMQKALAQFVRSIQSFDAKYDEGYQNGFTNFSDSEKRGRQLFTTDPDIPNSIRIGGGVGCFNCHRPPAFDINPSAGNNGIIGVANMPGEIDLDNTRAPSLRNITNAQGEVNGPMMHDASIKTLSQLITRISRQEADVRNTKRDPIFGTGASDLRITKDERDDLIAFLNTLSGKDVYTNEKWSDPFK